ncbi:MAG: PAS domain S-box protein [Ignavibacteriales bacterium]|nr:PAS domain S-box protein [Ignavibacteriales bacterium]
MTRRIKIEQELQSEIAKLKLDYEQLKSRYEKDIVSNHYVHEEKRAQWEQLAKQQDILVETATCAFVAQGDVKSLSIFLTERVAQYLQVERVSVWLFDKSATQLVCVDLFELSKNAHSSGTILHELEYWNEFEALKNNKYIDIVDVLSDPLVAGYVETYLKPRGISSMLAGMICYSGKTSGALCVEHVQTPHYWTTEEIVFVCQLADQIALTLANHERKLAEEALRQSETRFRELYDEAPVGYHELDNTGCITRVNQTELTMLGYTSEEMLGRYVWEFILEKEISKKSVLAKLAGTPIEGQNPGRTYLKKDGTQIAVMPHDKFLKDQDGKIIGIRTTLQDISLLKRNEKALMESEARLKRAERASKSGNWELHLDSEKVIYSEGAELLYGIIHGSSSFDDIKKIPLPEYREPLDSAMKMLIANGEPYDIEFKIKHPVSGKIIDIHSVAEFDHTSRIVFGVIQDITSRKQTEKELRDSEERFRVLFEGAPDAIILADPETGMIVDANKAACQLLARPYEEIITMHQHELHPPQNEEVSKAKFKQHIKESQDTGSTHPIELILIRSDGSQIPIEILAQLIRFQERTLLMGTFRNITGRKLVEQALQESEKKYRSLVQYSSDPIFSFNTDGSYRFVNEAFAKAFEKSPGEIIGKNPHSVFPAVEAEKRLATIKKVIQTGKKEEIEVVIVQSNGEKKYFLTMVDPIKDEGGTVLWISCVSKDITERKRTELALRFSEERFRNLLQSVPLIAVQGYGKDGTTQYWNEASERLYGYTAQEAIGRNLLDLIIPAELEDGIREAVKSSLQSGIPVPAAELTLKRKDGTRVAVLSSHAVVRIPGLEPELFCLDIDISERKRAEEEITIANKKLEKLVSEKDKLFSIIAHDLRSPFHGLIGLTEILATEHNLLSAVELEKYSKAVNIAVLNLYKLLENLLEWAQLQKESISYTPAEINLHGIFTQSADAVKQSALQKAIAIKNEIPKHLTVYADEKMINSVLRNLLSNAVKFTERNGTVIAHAEVTAGGMIQINITDNGIGIPKNSISKLFQLGEKVSTRGTENEPSTGLGLILCKEFIEKHGGRIWAESIEKTVDEPHSGGSTFCFTLAAADKQNE